MIRVMQKEMKDYQYFEPAYKAYRDHFKEFYDTGVTVIAGTDMVMYQSPFRRFQESCSTW